MCRRQRAGVLSGALSSPCTSFKATTGIIPGIANAVPPLTSVNVRVGVLLGDVLPSGCRWTCLVQFGTTLRDERNSTSAVYLSRSRVIKIVYGLHESPQFLRTADNFFSGMRRTGAGGGTGTETLKICAPRVVAFTLYREKRPSPQSRRQFFSEIERILQMHASEARAD